MKKNLRSRLLKDSMDPRIAIIRDKLPEDQAMTALEKILLVSRGTIYNRVHDPEGMTLYEIVRMVEALNLSDAEIVAFVRGGKKDKGENTSC